jgi:hypothetical protein
MAVVWKFPGIKAGMRLLPAISGLAPTFLGSGSTPQFYENGYFTDIIFQGK